MLCGRPTNPHWVEQFRRLRATGRFARYRGGLPLVASLPLGLPCYLPLPSPLWPVSRVHWPPMCAQGALGVFILGRDRIRIHADALYLTRNYSLGSDPDTDMCLYKPIIT